MKIKTLKFLLNKFKKLGLFDDNLLQGGMTDKELDNDRTLYQKLNHDLRFKMDKSTDYICRFDKYAQNGFVESGYFVQDIWGARKIFQTKPNIHYDVGSSVSGFIAHLLSMKQRTVLIDIRHMENSLDTKFLNMGGGGTIYSSKCNKFGWY